MNCYVLTGGRSTRMGRSKSELFLGRVAEAATPVFSRVVAVQREGSPAVPFPTVYDWPHHEQAPLFGIAAALEHAGGPCFVIATDYPLVTTDALRYLRERFEDSDAPIVVAGWEGMAQPLCGGYRPEVLPVIRRRATAGKLDVRGLLTQCAAVTVSEADLRSRFGERILMNVNTPAELLEAETLMKKPDPDFSHLDETGGISMVNVGSKRSTWREAVASATVRMSKETLQKLIDRAIPKGDVLTTAKVAGVLGAKATPSLIPMTHPVALSSIDVTFDLDAAGGTIEIRSIVRCDGKTGVEMEALTACATAALTIYDMCKSVEKGITIDNLQLMRKSGGKSGVWER